MHRRTLQFFCCERLSASMARMHRRTLQIVSSKNSYLNRHANIEASSNARAIQGEKAEIHSSLAGWSVAILAQGCLGSNLTDILS